MSDHGPFSIFTDTVLFQCQQLQTRIPVREQCRLPQLLHISPRQAQCPACVCYLVHAPGVTAEWDGSSAAGFLHIPHGNPFIPVLQTFCLQASEPFLRLLFPSQDPLRYGPEFLLPEKQNQAFLPMNLCQRRIQQPYIRIPGLYADHLILHGDTAVFLQIHKIRPDPSKVLFLQEVFLIPSEESFILLFTQPETKPFSHLCCGHASPTSSAVSPHTHL